MNDCSMCAMRNYTLTYLFLAAEGPHQSCQVELSVMREIFLLEYVKRGRNICKTRSALPEVAKQPIMPGGPGAWCPGHIL